MGYYTRYRLRALNPTTLEVSDPKGWPRAFVSSVVNNIYPRYNGEVPWDPRSGALFGSESVKWYEHEADLSALSSSHPQFVWALQGQGEEPDDEWTMYAYRGGSYKAKKEPWTPPPPDMNRLPTVVRVKVPEDPPDLVATVDKLLEDPVHEPSCSAWEHPVGFDDGQCTCIISTLREARRAMAEGKSSWSKATAK